MLFFIIMKEVTHLFNGGYWCVVSNRFSYGRITSSIIYIYAQ